MFGLIKTKKESREFIRKAGLNTVPEIELDKSEHEKIREFIRENKTEDYVFFSLREADHSCGIYEYVGSYEECLSKLHRFDNRIILSVSVKCYKSMVLLGTVEFTSGNTVRLCATVNPALDHRSMFNGEAEFDFETDIFDDRRLNAIPEFDFVYRYISDNDLFDKTVEFTVYDRPVGTKNQRILINEVRNY